jgi:hypothetical protein
LAAGLGLIVFAQITYGCQLLLYLIIGWIGKNTEQTIDLHLFEAIVLIAHPLGISGFSHGALLIFLLLGHD